MTTIIKNGNIVTSKETYRGDLIIKDGIIKKITRYDNNDYQKSICANTDEYSKIIDAEGKYLLPGAIDSHTHLDLDVGAISTSDNFYTGSKAAIAGGTTMFIDFATQEKEKTLKEAVEKWDNKAKRGSFCDYSYHMAIIDWNENIKAEMQEIVDYGIPSFKMYMAYKNTLQVDDGVIYEALKESKKIGGIIGFHCENGDLITALSNELVQGGKSSPYFHQYSRPEILEKEAIGRLGEIAKLADAYFWIVHLSANISLNLVKILREKGVKILCETCPQYLVLDNSVYGKVENNSFEGAKYVLSPPIREKNNLKQLWQGVKESEIELISTDHCSFNYKKQKELGRNDFMKIPNGGPGIEHRLSLVYTYGVCEGLITINEMVKVLSENPAKYFGIKNKGMIKQGYNADLIIFNPDSESIISKKTQVQDVDYTPYEGYKIKGKIETVLLRGKKIYEDNKFIIDNPTGVFIKREKFDAFS